MRVGINLLNFGPGASPESFVDWTLRAEAMGYHMVMISDHVAITPDVAARYPAPFYDPLTTLAWLAGQTSVIELGTTVLVVPYRNPLLVARMTANLDRFSGGRFIFGVGVGGPPLEFAALGQPRHERGAMADDYLAAIVELWTHERASYDGRYVSFADVQSGPMPVQSPHPPIWVGGASDAALRRAVRFGGGWHPISVPVNFLRDDGLPRLRRIADDAGRPMPDLCPRIRFRLTESPLADDERLVGEGTLEQVHDDLAELEALGAACVLLDTYASGIEATADHESAWRMFTALADEVLDLTHESVR